MGLTSSIANRYGTNAFYQPCSHLPSLQQHPSSPVARTPSGLVSPSGARWGNWNSVGERYIGERSGPAAGRRCHFRWVRWPTAGRTPGGGRAVWSRADDAAEAAGRRRWRRRRRRRQRQVWCGACVPECRAEQRQSAQHVLLERESQLRVGETTESGHTRPRARRDVDRERVYGGSRHVWRCVVRDIGATGQQRSGQCCELSAWCRWYKYANRTLI